MKRFPFTLFFGVSLGVLIYLCPGHAQVGGYGWRITNTSGPYLPGRPGYYPPQRNNATGWNRQRNNITGLNPQWSSTNWYPQRNNTSWSPQRNYYPTWTGRRLARSVGSTNTTNGGHSFFWGNWSPRQRLLYTSRVTKGRSFMKKVTVDVDFPAKFQEPTGTISFIQVLDLEPAGEGGYASILKGGVGHRNVTIHFKSQRNRPLDFNVNIYGH